MSRACVVGMMPVIPRPHVMLFFTLAVAAIGCAGGADEPDQQGSDAIIISREWGRSVESDLKAARTNAEQLRFALGSLSGGRRGSLDDAAFATSLTQMSAIAKASREVLVKLIVQLAKQDAMRGITEQVDVSDAEYAKVLNATKKLVDVEIPRLEVAIPKLAVAIDRRSADRLGQFNDVFKLASSISDEFSLLVGIVSSWAHATGAESPSPSGSNACVSCFENGVCWAQGGGCFENGVCWSAGGGCHQNGVCWGPGGGCHENGVCWKAGGSCHQNGVCVKGTPSVPVATCNR